MRPRYRSVAIAQMLLIAPALLFLTAVMVQSVGSTQDPAGAAHLIVAWYAARMWTLWVLLLAFPLAVFGAGCVALRSRRAGNSRIAILLQRVSALRTVTAMTVIAAGVLAVVVLHMAAN